MLFKVAVVVALGALGLMALWQMADARVADNTDRKQERLEQAVAAQLQSLREHLFKR
jgi:hypothetical protein